LQPISPCTICTIRGGGGESLGRRSLFPALQSTIRRNVIFNDSVHPGLVINVSLTLFRPSPNLVIKRLSPSLSGYRIKPTNNQNLSLSLSLSLSLALSLALSLSLSRSLSLSLSLSWLFLAAYWTELNSAAVNLDSKSRLGASAPACTPPGTQTMPECRFNKSSQHQKHGGGGGGAGRTSLGAPSEKSGRATCSHS
jgi:hypothetical protein